MDKRKTTDQGTAREMDCILGWHHGTARVEKELCPVSHHFRFPMMLLCYSSDLCSKVHVHRCSACYTDMGPQHLPWVPVLFIAGFEMVKAKRWTTEQNDGPSM